ncbi:F-box protein-like protein [Tanacetum coccineum]
MGLTSISLLPDCLLIDIISRLPSTIEAIRICTLSKRWQHLWHYVSDIIFSFDMCILNWNDQRLSNFVSSVDKTLIHCRQCNLTEFKLFVGYDSQFESQLNNWIRRALSCNVQDLHLLIWNKFSESEFVLDQLFSINSRKLDEGLIKNILSGSPLLETLELDYCYGFRRIDITSKSVKNFVFFRHFTPEEPLEDLDDIIEINDPYIVSLTVAGDLLLWKLLLLNVCSSSLVES